MPKLVSVISPIFCEENNINLLHQEIIKICRNFEAITWEFLFVNDGSKDNSMTYLRELAKRDDRCKIIDLSRNFGKEIALSAGIAFANGDAVICIDSDLQHPPDRIPEMIKAWLNGAEVVEMVRRKSENESLFRRLGSYWFYYLINKLSTIGIKSQTTDFRLLDRKVVEELKKINEKQRLFRGLIDWLGYKKVSLTFDASSRQSGNTTYSYRKLIGLALDSFVSYSSTPLKLIGVVGFLTMIGSAGLMTWMILSQMFIPTIFNYTPLTIFVIANTFLMSLILCSLGLIALYIRKIHLEVQARPLFTVRETINFQ